MKNLVVSETEKPRLWPTVVQEWERSLDPWHPDAFKGIKGVEETFRRNYEGGPRKSGWMAIDWCGNPIGFIPDGTPIEEYVGVP